MTAKITLDEARDHFFVAQRACERFAQQLGQLLDALNGMERSGAWLDEVQTEAAKAVQFHSTQLDSFTAFAARTDTYVASVRQLGEQLALQELKGGADADDADVDARTVHPELLRFKQEKMAKILGRMGGVPALGGGAVLPRAPRESAPLRATESPAAREIHYGRVEDKDARFLADVFQFRKQDAATGGGGGGGGAAAPGGGGAPRPAPSPWQQEVLSRKGRGSNIVEAGGDSGVGDTDGAAAAASAAAPMNADLAAALRQRQSKISDAEAAAAAAAEEAAVAARRASAGSDVSAELAAKLKRRQASGAVTETPSPPIAAAPAAAEASSEGTAPRGLEGAAPPALPPGLRRSSGATPLPGMAAGASNELMEKLRRRQASIEESEQ